MWFGTESGRSTGVVGDTVAPTVSYSQSPAANGAGYNNTAVSVTLTATDNVGGSGVASVTYKVDTGSTS